MDYSLDDFQALVVAVENQGGTQLDEPCVRKDVVFKSPPYVRKRVDKKNSCGCNNRARFISEYNGETGQVQLITACAVCDNMGEWPRYLTVLE